VQSRMTNPVAVLPDALKALVSLSAAAETGTVPAATHKLVHLRASQINGCGVCVDMHARELRQLGESRLADRSDPVPDAVWDDVADHYDEKELAGLILSIAAINAWNRINATTRQIAGAAWG